jgi:hypothetical protein
MIAQGVVVTARRSDRLSIVGALTGFQCKHFLQHYLIFQ